MEAEALADAEFQLVAVLLEAPDALAATLVVADKISNLPANPDDLLLLAAERGESARARGKQDDIGAEQREDGEPAQFLPEMCHEP